MGDTASSPDVAADHPRREQLLDAAERLIGRVGPDVSVAAIAAEAGITKPIVYRAFGSKGGLCQALLERHTDVLLADLRRALRTRGTWRDRTYAAVDAYLGFLADRLALYEFLRRSEEAGEVDLMRQVVTFEQVVVGVLDDGLRRDLDVPDAQAQLPAVWANAIVGMVHQTSMWWLADETPIPRHVLTAELTTIVTAGVGAALAAWRTT